MCEREMVVGRPMPSSERSVSGVRVTVLVSLVIVSSGRASVSDVQMETRSSASSIEASRRISIENVGITGEKENRPVVGQIGSFGHGVIFTQWTWWDYFP